MSWHLRVFIAVALIVSVVGVMIGCSDDDNPAKPEPVADDPNALGVVRTDWRLSSTPYPLLAYDDEWTRGTMRWHNLPAIARVEVYNDETQASGGALVPLRLIFRPHGYKYTGGADNPCSDSMLARSWGGIMAPFEPGFTTGGPLAFEMRAKGGRGVLHFDFGRINEDINGNGLYENEDRNYPYNEVLDDGEDTGLDLMLDSGETDICGNVYNVNTSPDPVGDNWWFEGEGKGAGPDNRPPVPLSLWNTSGYQAAVNDLHNWRHYEWINGTEGNIEDPASSGLPDREFAGPSVNEFNHYFGLTVSLDTLSSPYVVPGSARNGWITYRVALCACPGVVDTVADEHFTNQMTWSAVRQVRVWFEKDSAAVDSIASMDSVWIAHWKLLTSF